MPRKRKAKIEAQKLLTDFKVENPPIDLVGLLKFLDLEYIEFDPAVIPIKDIEPNKVSAFIEYSTNTIMYNKTHPKTRLRFSIAHEIGHYQLNHKSFPHETEYNPKSSMEIEANIFAAELLMPAFLIEKESINSKTDIQRIADKYKVSFEAADLRIRLDSRLVPTGFDVSIVNRKHKLYDDNSQEIDDVVEHYPPYEGYIDDYDEAYQYFTENSFEDIELRNILDEIEEEGQEDLYPKTFKALSAIVDELD